MTPIQKAMTNELPNIDHASQTINVCAWCHPGTSFLKSYQGYAAISYYRFNHGICDSHKEEMLWKIKGRLGPLWLIKPPSDVAIVRS